MGKQFNSTVAVIYCAKAMLLSFNSVYSVFGLALTAAGLWAQLQLYRYASLSPEFSDTALYVVLGVGALVVFVGLLAFSCILKGQATLLYVYGAVLGVICMMKLGAAVSAATYRERIAAGLQDVLVQSVRDYSGSADVDLSQSWLHCCGVSNYTDWQQYGPQKTVPPSCCSDVPACDTSDPQNLFSQGCYEILRPLLQPTRLAGAVALGVAMFPAAGALLSCCLAGVINTNKYVVN